MKRARHLILPALLCLASAAVEAQEWRGPASIALEVKGKPRGAVAEALVVLRFQQMDPPAGPRPVLTDTAGRAVVADLAEGVWEVEVSHPDFLSFVALVLVQNGKKPAVQASFLQASGSSLTPIRVKFMDGKGKAPSASVPLPPEAAARLAQRRPPPPARVPDAAASEPPRSARSSPRPPETVMPDPELRPLPATARPAGAPVPPPPPPAEPPLAVEPAPKADTPAPKAENEPAPEIESEPAPPAPRPAAPTTAAQPEPAAPMPAAPAPPPAAKPIMTEPEPAAELPAPDTPPDEPEPMPTVEPMPAVEPPQTLEPMPAVEPMPAPEPAPSAPAEPPDQKRPAPPVPPRAAAEPPPTRAETMPAPPTAAEATPAPQPASEAPETPPATPAPPPPPAAPMTVQPAPGPLGPTLRAYRDRTCVECRPGEFAISVETVIGPATAPCGGTLEAAGRELATLLGGSIDLEIKEVAATAATAVGLMGSAEPAARAAELLGSDVDACRLVAVVIPKAGRFRGARMEAADATGVGDCPADRPCAVGQARWLGQPRVAREPSANVIWSLFVNEAPDRARRARLTVYFAAPYRAWDPPR